MADYGRDLDIGRPPVLTQTVDDPKTQAAVGNLVGEFEQIQNELGRTRLGNELFVYGSEVDSVDGNE